MFKLLENNRLEKKTIEYKAVNFQGCPAPMTIHIIGGRQNTQQKEIWSNFYTVMTKSQESDIDFRMVKSWYGINIGSYTIFLFWIDSKNFLPLDKNTIALLEKYNLFNGLPKQYKDYKDILMEKNTLSN